MAFGLSDGRVTSDVDAAFRKTEGPVDQAVARVANRQHRVPLCGRAVEILDAARTFGDDGSRTP